MTERSPLARWFSPRLLRMQAAVLVIALWGGTAFNYSNAGPVKRTGTVKGGDFAHFYSIAALAAAHRGPAMYDRDAQRDAFVQAVPGLAPPAYLPFLYPPHVGLFLVPFGLAAYVTSLLLWWAAMTTVYLTVCGLVWTHTRLRASRADLLLFALAFPGFWELFIYGHTTWIALGCFAAIWWDLRHDGWLLAGIATGVLTYKPQLGIALFLALLADRQWRVLATAAATVAVLQILALAWFGRDVFPAYLAMAKTLPDIAPLVEPNQYQLCSIRGFFTVLGVPGRVATGLYVAVGGAACLWLLRIRRIVPFDVAFALLTILSVLIAPHATVYDLVLLALPLILLVDAGLSVRKSGGLWPLIYAAYLLPFMVGIVQALHVQVATPVLLWLMHEGGGLRPERSD